MHTEGGGSRGRGMGTSCTPSKEFEKFGDKNAIKCKNREPRRFSHNPQCVCRWWFQHIRFHRHGPCRFQRDEHCEQQHQQPQQQQ